MHQLLIAQAGKNTYYFIEIEGVLVYNVGSFPPQTVLVSLPHDEGKIRK